MSNGKRTPSAAAERRGTASNNNSVGARFLQSSGAAVLLHSLTQRMLHEKPDDPQQWLHDHIRARKFHVTPTHMRSLLPHASTTSLPLFVQCLTSCSPDGFDLSHQQFTGYATLMKDCAETLHCHHLEDVGTSQLPTFAAMAVEMAKGRAALKNLVATCSSGSNDQQQQQQPSSSTPGQPPVNARPSSSSAPQLQQDDRPPSSGEQNKQTPAFHIVCVAPLCDNIRDRLSELISEITWLLDGATSASNTTAAATFAIVLVEIEQKRAPSLADLARAAALEMGLAGVVRVVDADSSTSPMTAVGRALEHARQAALCGPSGRQQTSQPPLHSAVILLNSMVPCVHIGSLGGALSDLWASAVAQPQPAEFSSAAAAPQQPPPKKGGQKDGAAPQAAAAAPIKSIDAPPVAALASMPRSGVAAAQCYSTPLESSLAYILSRAFSAVSPLSGAADLFSPPALLLLPSAIPPLDVHGAASNAPSFSSHVATASSFAFPPLLLLDVLLTVRAHSKGGVRAAAVRRCARRRSPMDDDDHEQLSVHIPAIKSIAAHLRAHDARREINDQGVKFLSDANAASIKKVVEKNAKVLQEEAAAAAAPTESCDELFRRFAEA